MDDLELLHPAATLRHATLEELRTVQEVTAPFGLRLSEAQMLELADARIRALGDTQRMEFEGGIYQKLAYAFCDSPYIGQHNYADVLLELMESFYYFKNESMDQLADDELIDWMKRHFDGICQGSLEYLSETAMEELCRDIRFGHALDDRDLLP